MFLSLLKSLVKLFVFNKSLEKTMFYKVSIISAIYNSEKWLEECLESLVNQTLKDIEIILVNDASPDNSLDILKAYKNKYPNLIKLIDLKENIGGGGALNRGLEVAQGEYVNFVDADDYVDVTMCEKLYARAKKDNADILQFNGVKFYDKGMKVSKACIKHGKKVHVMPAEFFLDGVMQECYRKDCVSAVVGHHWSRFYRASLMKENIRFPENNKFFDFPMIFLPIVLANKIIKTDEKFYYYRQRVGSVCSSKDHAGSFINHIDGVEFVINECVRLDLYEKYKENIIAYMVDRVYSRFELLFRSRDFYKSHSNIYKYLSVTNEHLKKIEAIYPGYTDKIFEFCEKKNKRKLKILFSYPIFIKIWLDIKFGLKNLFHKVF
jgi:glycosyltransferase involved in cell wall biosynthesis